MSRSKKKSPFTGMTCSSKKAGRQRHFRSQENRAKRRYVNKTISGMINTGSNDQFTDHYGDMMFPHEKQYGNEWASPRDGKCYFGEDKHLPEFKKYMRK